MIGFMLFAISCAAIVAGAEIAAPGVLGQAFLVLIDVIEHRTLAADISAIVAAQQ